MASVAIARDLGAPGQPLAKVAIRPTMRVLAVGADVGQPAPVGQLAGPAAEQAAGQPDADGEAPAGSVAGFAQLLVAQIPGEALLAYTTLLALFAVGGGSYNAGRWGLYAGAIVVCAAAVLGGYFMQRDYGFDDTRTTPAPAVGSAPPTADAPAPAQVTALAKLHLPYLPILTAVLAMAIYGLTVPGSPLQFEVSGTAFAICSGCLAVGGGVMMSIFAPFLGKGNAAKAVRTQSGSASPPTYLAESGGGALLSDPTTMDAMTAIQFGQLVSDAYQVLPSDLTNSAGNALSAGGTDYTVITTIYANDLATNMNPGRGDDTVSIGLICQANGAGDVVIAIRGTEGIWEWIHDAEFLTVPCPFLAGAGHTEDGFTAVYNSLRTGVAPYSPSVVNALGSLAFPRPVTSVTVCGHSLGGALATLLALDLAANSVFNDPVVYTYGSPRTGDSLFVSTFNQVVKNSYRIQNRLDIVPKLPPPPWYEHVLEPSELTPVQLFPLPAKLLVDFTPVCEHLIATYLYLLSLKSGGPVIPLDANCQPEQRAPVLPVNER